MMEHELEEPVGQSFLGFLFHSLGMEVVAILMVAGLLSVAVSLLIVIRGKGPMAAAALVLIVWAPLLIGAFAGLVGAISSFMVIAQSAVAPKPADVAQGFGAALLGPLVGLIAAGPGFLIAFMGSVVRSFSTESGRGSIEDAGADHRRSRE